MGEHVQAENKHSCSYCGGTIGACEAEDNDYLCDACGIKLIGGETKEY